MKAIRVHRHGGPDVLAYEGIDIGEPEAGEVRVRNWAIGVNFVDTYLRSGVFPPPRMPFTPGKEGAGEVLAVGENVSGFALGDRVAYAVETLGGYAEECIVPAHFLVHLPDAIEFETAAAMMLKGLTAQFLLRRAFRVEGGAHNPYAGSRWWRWQHPDAMGQPPRRDRHRHGRLSREGRVRAPERLRLRHRLPQGGLCRAR
jgi:NADPH:quinone reductase